MPMWGWVSLGGLKADGHGTRRRHRRAPLAGVTRDVELHPALLGARQNAAAGACNRPEAQEGLDARDSWALLPSRLCLAPHCAATGPGTREKAAGMDGCEGRASKAAGARRNAKPRGASERSLSVRCLIEFMFSGLPPTHHGCGKPGQPSCPRLVYAPASQPARPAPRSQPH